MIDINNLFHLFIAGFAIVMLILALLTPLFVMQIRDTSKRIEKQLAAIVAKMPASR